MWQFFKYVFATIIGLLLFTIISILLLAGIGSTLGSKSDEKTNVETNSVLKINLDKPIQEVAVENPFAEFSGGQGDVAGLLDIKKAIDNAAADPNIKGIYLETQYPMAGWASVEEIRNSLINFKKKKKFIYTYAEVMSEKAYYLASVADRIYLNPAGGMEWNGLSAEYDFYKGTLDKLEIKPLVFRVGDFKSAVEPFLRSDMSDSNKVQSKVLVSGIFNHALKNIATSRGLNVATLNKLADDLTIESPQSALENKLITHIGYYDEVEAALKNELKLKSDDKIKFVSLGKYENAENHLKEGNSENRIAVITGEGSIVSGDGDESSIGSDKISEELRKARKDKKVKAVVLRINSPGGSALASDVMWREVQLTRKEKPVIASMSDVAASGGYYMAMGCDKIVAQPNTITGSIGVFSVLFNLENFMKNKLGVTFDRVNSNTHADWPTVTRTMSDVENARIQKSTDNIYKNFTQKAADGRKMPVEKLRAVASGRVWSGEDAKARGLVDELGGFDKAVEVAAAVAKLKAGDYRLKFYTEKKNVLDQLMDKFGKDAEERAVMNQLGEFAPYLKTLKKLQKIEGTQARMPFDIEIK